MAVIRVPCGGLGLVGPDSGGGGGGPEGLGALAGLGFRAAVPNAGDQVMRARCSPAARSVPARVQGGVLVTCRPVRLVRGSVAPGPALAKCFR